MTGAEMKAARTAARLSQEALAERVGVSRFTILRHERAPSVPQVLALAVRQVVSCAT